MKKLLLFALTLLLFSCSDQKSIDIAKSHLKETHLSNDIDILKYDVSKITDKEAFYLLYKKYDKQYISNLASGITFKGVSDNKLKYSKLENDSKGLLKYKKVDFSKVMDKDTINKGYVIIDNNEKYVDFAMVK